MPVSNKHPIRDVCAVWIRQVCDGDDPQEKAHFIQLLKLPLSDPFDMAENLHEGAVPFPLKTRSPDLLDPKVRADFIQALSNFKEETWPNIREFLGSMLHDGLDEARL